MNAILLTALLSLSAAPPAEDPVLDQAASASPEGAVAADGCGAPPPPRVVFVPYVTNRNITRRTAQGPSYGGGRGQLTFGTAQVSVPASHTRGCLETPGTIPLTGLQFPASVERHVTYLEADQTSQGEFLRAIRQRVQRSATPEVLVFVHGYNVSFRDAARRVAQITADMGFQGVVVLFSWPSNGATVAYQADEQAADASVFPLEQVLRDLRRHSGARALHVIAHSMGNQVVSRALENFGNRSEPIVDEVVFTAPDVDRQAFVQRLSTMRKAARRLTLYASDTDMALKGSQQWARYVRAGQAGRNLIVDRMMETVDATRVNMDFLGHSYFVAEPVLDDLRGIVGERRPPAQRGLTAAPGGRYWRFRRN